jgi:hypothetical protein
MSDIQTTYPFDYASNIKGTLKGPRGGAFSPVTVFSDEAIGFGVGLRLIGYDDEGTGNLMNQTHKVAMPTAGTTAAQFFGVSEFRHQESTNPRQFMTELASTADSNFKAKTPFPCRRRGYIKVYSETAVAFGDSVFWRIATNGTLTAGNFRASADGTNTVQLTSVRWDGTLTAAGLIYLEMLLP